MEITKHFDVREFVPKDVYDRFGQQSWQFVSDAIVKMTNFAYDFFTNYYKQKDLTVDHISILINNWHLGGTFENRGLRTIGYINSQVAKGIKTAMLSQHVGGSTNAVDLNIIITYKGGRKLTVNSDEIWSVIFEHQKEFIAAGLTTLEDKSMTKGWTHCDCRHTGLDTLYIVKP